MEKKKTKKRIFRIVFFVALIALAIWTVWSNGAAELNKTTVTSDRLPKSFDGYKIALVSDLHNAEFGENNIELIEMLKQASPDIIAITGDIVDSYRTDTDIALAFAEQVAKIAPCYYVSGNHEGRIEASERERLFTGLEERGIVILADEEAFIEKNGEKISLLGVEDAQISNKDVSSTGLKELSSFDGYTILLCHRPNFFKSFVRGDIDLALCGHVHGGQFRLPFIGGIYAPDQGVFPEYDAGLYTEGSTNMVVSRGIGNSVFPIRFNNRPEIVLVELKSEN